MLHAQAPVERGNVLQAVRQRRHLLRRPPAPAAATSATARRLRPSSCRCRRSAVPQPGDAVWLEFPPELTRIYTLNLLPSHPPHQRRLTMKKIIARHRRCRRLGAAGAGAQQLTVVNFGGANANAQKKAFYEPVREDRASRSCPSNTTASRPRSRRWSRPRRSPGTSSRSNRPTSPAAATKVCSRSSTTARSAPRADFLPAAVSDCGVGIFVWSTVMAYDGDKLKTAPDDLGRLLGHEEVPRQARHAQGRALQPRVRADGRRRQAGRRLQGARHQGRRRSRVQEADRAEAEHPVVGSRRAAAAVPGRRRRGA